MAKFIPYGSYGFSSGSMNLGGLDYNLNSADTSFRVGAKQYDYGGWDGQYNIPEPAASSSSAKDTGTLGNIMVGAAIGQAISGVYSAFVGAKALAHTQKRQAEIEADNAEIMRMGVEQAYRQGEAQIAKLTQRAGQIKASQKAIAAANGIAVGVGNSKEIEASTELQKQADVATARMNALQAAWGYNRKALQYDAQSYGLSKMSSANSSLAPAAGVSSLLTGGTQVAQTWYMWKGGF